MGVIVKMEDITREVLALEPRTREIVLLFLDLLLQAQETGQTVSEVPEIT